MSDLVDLERSAYQLDLVSRWADDLAHEIKNPLHAMVINLELVKRRAGGEAGPVVERAEIVESELRRVHHLIDSLLRLLRPWPDNAATSTEQVFDALLPAITARARVRNVGYEHQGGGGIAAIPPADLALILVNLVDLAFCSMPEGGRLVTRTRVDDGSLAVIVVDSSSPPDGTDTRSADLAGAGLALVDRLVRSVGGSVTIGSVPDGSGTEVVVTLPRTGSA